MTDAPDRPHDTFFKETFSDEAKAAAELTSVLPPRLAALFDWSTLRLEPAILASVREQNRQNDLVFSVRRADLAATVLVLVLLEHQSTDDPLMPLRILRYMLRIWDAWLRRPKTTAPPLPPILPVVLAHDPRGWRSARHFHELFAVDPGTRAIVSRFVPSFEIAIDDLARVGDEALAARGLPPGTTLSLWALRDARSPSALLQHAPFFAPLFAALGSLPGGQQDAHRIFGYVGQAAGPRSVDLDELASTLLDHAPAGRQVIMNSVDKLIARGRTEGMAIGRTEGMAVGRTEGVLEGQRSMLLKQLRLKFGQLGDRDVQRVEQADAEALERFLERIVTADSLAAVLGD